MVIEIHELLFTFRYQEVQPVMERLRELEEQVVEDSTPKKSRESTSGRGVGGSGSSKQNTKRG